MLQLEDFIYRVNKI